MMTMTMDGLDDSNDFVTFFFPSGLVWMAFFWHWHWALAWTGLGLVIRCPGFFRISLFFVMRVFELRQLYSLSNSISEMQYDITVLTISPGTWFEGALLTMLSVICHIGRS